MKSLNKEVLLIAICAALVLTSTYALYRELTGRIDKSDSEAIGSITFKKKNAERKYAEFVIWEDIANNSPVYNYDSLRTFEGSAAYIKLNNGAEISLDEDTMIVLIADDDGVKINFDRGSVSAKSGEGSENISLNTKDISISMDKGELAVKKGADVVDVNVSSGEVRIDTGEGVKTIDNNAKAQIINGKTEVKKITIIPELPANNTFFVTCKEKGFIDFKWNSESSEDATIQISKDSKFADIAFTAKTSGKGVKAEIPPGDYYWRVVSGGETSSVKKFILLRDSIPELIYPIGGEKISVTGDDEAVSFKWNSSDHVSSYELEIFQEQNPEKNIKKMNVNQNIASVTGIPASHLWWRITRNYPDGFVVLDNKSAANSFNLERQVFTMVRPKPLHDGEMFASTLNDNIIFNWESGKGVKDFTVDIASDRDFKNIIKTSSAPMTFYNAGKLPEGKYYWRVKANYEKHESLLSETVALTVTPPEPVVYLTPQNDAIMTDSEDSIKFTWKDVSEAGNYSFEASGDPGFKNIILSSKTDSRIFTMKNPGPGKYYWRVSIIDRSGSLTAKGLTSGFIIPETLKKPVAILPANMGVVNLDNSDSIKFQWAKVEGADSYEVEIFQRVAGVDRSLIVLNTDTNRVELRNFTIFDPGTIVWVVRAAKSVKGKISATSESERSYFVLKVSEEISAPKLDVPGTIYVR